MTIATVLGLYAAAVVSPGERPMTASPPPRPLVGGARIGCDARSCLSTVLWQDARVISEGDRMSVVVISPHQPGVATMLAESDAYMAALYPAESNHMTDISALADPAVTFLGIVEDGQAVSCGALVRQDGGCAELKRMFVPDHRRGCGYGKAILRELLAIADAEGLTLRLETGVRQPEAIGLYRSHGFADVEPFEPYAPDPLSVFMERGPRSGSRDVTSPPPAVRRGSRSGRARAPAGSAPL